MDPYILSKIIDHGMRSDITSYSNWIYVSKMTNHVAFTTLINMLPFCNYSKRNRYCDVFPEKASIFSLYKNTSSTSPWSSYIVVPMPLSRYCGTKFNFRTKARMSGQKRNKIYREMTFYEFIKEFMEFELPVIRCLYLAEKEPEFSDSIMDKLISGFNNYISTAKNFNYAEDLLPIIPKYYKYIIHNEYRAPLLNYEIYCFITRARTHYEQYIINLKNRLIFKYIFVGILLICIKEHAED